MVLIFLNFSENKSKNKDKNISYPKQDIIIKLWKRINVKEITTHGFQNQLWKIKLNKHAYQMKWMQWHRDDDYDEERKLK